MLTCPPACLLTGREAGLSVWGVCATVIRAGPWGPSPHSWSPAVPGSEQISREESGPVSVARFSSWCPVRVSPPPHSPGLCRRGQQPQEGQTRADHTGAVEVSKTSHPCPRSAPSFSLILSDARGSSRNEVTPLPDLSASLSEVLVALTGVEALQRSWNCVPQGHPHFIASLADSETGTTSLFPSLFSLPLPFPHVPPSCLDRAFPGCVSSEGAAYLP